MNERAQETAFPLLELMTNPHVVGVKQLKKALCSGSVKCVFLAEDADPALSDEVLRLCETEQVPCTWVATMQELGAACGIDVGAAAAAALRPSL